VGLLRWAAVVALLAGIIVTRWLWVIAAGLLLLIAHNQHRGNNPPRPTR
jgi:hypothetical protein